MALLVQFLLRLTFGLALGMALTSPKLVSSGYFRNHLYVTLGLAALAALLSRSVALAAFWPAVLAAGLSYVGAVGWLYEKATAGRVALLAVSAFALGGAIAAGEVPAAASDGLAEWLHRVVPVSSGLLLGTTMAAMLLGHWYLNSPGMELKPLRQLLVAMSVALGLQLLLSASGLWGALSDSQLVSTQWILFVLLRWTFGLVGVGAMIWMAWQTLRIPNTQSATGILYVAVIGTFVGETMALLLSTESVFPL
ncbi:MAG: hypothetical protein ACR2NM_08380 [Bythopirellula sp.]